MSDAAAAVDRFWRGYLASLPPGHPHHQARPDAFAFGGAGPLGDELAALVLQGRKRATTSLASEFTSLGEPLPQTGSVSVILDGQDWPVAIIERVRVAFVAFDAVDETYAAIEGEDDGSLERWRANHLDYFGQVCERLGGRFDGRSEVICQEFRVIWPR